MGCAFQPAPPFSSRSPEKSGLLVEAFGSHARVWRPCTVVTPRIAPTPSPPPQSFPSQAFALRPFPSQGRPPGPCPVPAPGHPPPSRRSAVTPPPPPTRPSPLPGRPSPAGPSRDRDRRRGAARWLRRATVHILGVRTRSRLDAHSHAGNGRRRRPDHGRRGVARAACRAYARRPARPSARDARDPLAGCDRPDAAPDDAARSLAARSEEHTSELQSLMRISYAVFCLKKKKKQTI